MLGSRDLYLRAGVFIMTIEQQLPQRSGGRCELCGTTEHIEGKVNGVQIVLVAKFLKKA